jgi:hypothetical protein
MVAIPYKVYVVVDRNFGAQLNEIERGVPVWIVESQDNKPVVQRLWQERTFESHFEGITIFADSAGLSAEEILLGELDTIDLHHGIHSANPPYTVLEIVGVNLTVSVKTELVSLGFDDFQSTSTGFIATRPEPSRQ